MQNDSLQHQARMLIMRNATKHRLELMNAGATMKSSNFELMSTDELWTLHEEIIATLEGRLAADKTRLEERLRQLEQGVGPNRSGRNVGAGRRPYPPVLPKYKNPGQPSETWSGRGKQPRWLSAQLKSGKKLDAFRIKSSDHSRRLAH
jgi:DNA-binding protein H-NS